MLKLDPTNAIAHRCIGSIASSKGDYRQAAAQYKLAVRADPEDYRSMCDLGLMVGSLGDLKQAAEWMIASLKINPRAAQTHANYARVLSLQGKHAEARQEADLALSADADNPFFKQVVQEVRGRAEGK